MILTDAKSKKSCIVAYFENILCLPRKENEKSTAIVTRLPSTPGGVDVTKDHEQHRRTTSRIVGMIMIPRGLVWSEALHASSWCYSEEEGNGVAKGVTEFKKLCE